VARQAPDRHDVAQKELVELPCPSRWRLRHRRCEHVIDTGTPVFSFMVPETQQLVLIAARMTNPRRRTTSNCFVWKAGAIEAARLEIMSWL